MSEDLELICEERKQKIYQKKSEYTLAGYTEMLCYKYYWTGKRAVLSFKK